jgi:hypothetical protein
VEAHDVGRGHMKSKMKKASIIALATVTLIAMTATGAAA